MKKRKKRNSKIIIFYGYGQRLIAVIQRYNNSRSNDQILRFVSVSFVKKEQSSNEWFDGKKMHATEIIYLQIFSSNQSESTVKYRNRYTTCQRKYVPGRLSLQMICCYQPIKVFFSHGKRKVYFCTYIWKHSWKRLVSWIWPNFYFWQGQIYLDGP